MFQTRNHAKYKTTPEKHRLNRFYAKTMLFSRHQFTIHYAMMSHLFFCLLPRRRSIGAKTRCLFRGVVCMLLTLATLLLFKSHQHHTVKSTVFEIRQSAVGLLLPKFRASHMFILHFFLNESSKHFFPV